MEEILRNIIANIAETAPDFRADADLKDDLQVDSHRAVELVFEVERTFGIQIPGNRAEEMRTLNGVMALVQSLQAVHAQR
jgi:acyl carrier protein